MRTGVAVGSRRGGGRTGAGGMGGNLKDGGGGGGGIGRNLKDGRGGDRLCDNLRGGKLRVGMLAMGNIGKPLVPCTEAPDKLVSSKFAFIK